MRPSPRDCGLRAQSSSKRSLIQRSMPTSFCAPTNSGARHTKARRPECLTQAAGYQHRRRAEPLHPHLLDVRGLLALGTIDNLELHLFPLSKGLEACALDRREVDKNIFATITGDKPIAFAIIKPLNRTSWHELSPYLCTRQNTPRARGEAPLLRLQTAERGEGKSDYARHTHHNTNFPAPTLLHCCKEYIQGIRGCQAKELNVAYYAPWVI